MRHNSGEGITLTESNQLSHQEATKPSYNHYLGFFDDLQIFVYFFLVCSHFHMADY
jgi:hypothetical protein